MFGFGGMVVLFALIAVLLALKAYAIWYAARRNERVWFCLLIIFNTFGILELIYLIFIVGKWGIYTKATPADSVPPPATPPQV